MQRSRLLLKRKVLWLMIKARPVWRSFVYNVNSRASQPGMNLKREKDLREDMRFFLARVVSVTYQPWHLYTFHLCSCCCCEAPRFDRTIRVRWSHSLARLRPKGRRNVLFRHYNPLRVDRPWRSKGQLRLFRRLGLESLEFGKDYLLPWFMTEIQFPNTWLCGFDCIPIYDDIVVWH